MEVFLKYFLRFSILQTIVASFKFIKYNFAKLLDILFCLPFNLHLCEKEAVSQVLCRTNFTITSLRFCFWELYFSILWDLWISSTVTILYFMFSQIILMAISSITSNTRNGISCRKIQVYIEYRSCLLIFFSK